MALKYLKRIEKFKVFGFFYGYLINIDFFCHFYTSSNDQPVALTRAQSYFLKNKKVTKKLYLYEVSIKEIRQSRWVFFMDSSWCLVFFTDTCRTLFFPHLAKISWILFRSQGSTNGGLFWPILKVFNNQKWFWLPKLEADYFGQIQNV